MNLIGPSLLAAGGRFAFAASAQSGNRPGAGVIFVAVNQQSLFFSADGAAPLPRRAFLRYAGAASAGAALLLAGCKDTSDDPTNNTATANPNGESVGLGSGDVALINLIQAGKQLSVELFRQLLLTPNNLSLTPSELGLLTAIRDQQRVQRDTLKAAANTNRTGTSALNIKDLPVDFASLTLNERTAALTAALSHLNTLVAGAAGGLRYASGGRTMTLLGQILSVDARHAATVARMLPTAALTDVTASGDARNRALRPSETATAFNLLITSGSRLLTGSLA